MIVVVGSIIFLVVVARFPERDTVELSNHRMTDSPNWLMGWWSLFMHCSQCVTIGTDLVRCMRNTCILVGVLWQELHHISFWSFCASQS